MRRDRSKLYAGLTCCWFAVPLVFSLLSSERDFNRAFAAWFSATAAALFVPSLLGKKG